MVFTIKQKIDICLQAEANPHLTQLDLAAWAQKEFSTGKPALQTTISRILAQKDQLIAHKQHELLRVRRRPQLNELLRRVLVEWLLLAIWDGIPILIPILQSTAADFWSHLPPSQREGTGDFPPKWCYQFLARHNINLGNTERHAMTASRNKIWTFEERLPLQKLLEGYSAKDIFAIDEFQLCYLLPLDTTYYNEYPNILQRRPVIPHVTIVFGTNVDGSERLEPLVVGGFEHRPSTSPGGPSPLSLTSLFADHGIAYKWNHKAWLTLNQFYGYLLMLDKRLAAAGRKIAVLMDDCVAHKIINVNLLHIHLVVTNSGGDLNLTPAKLFLPLNWGIISEFKILYRLQQYLYMIRTQRALRNRSSPPQLAPLTMAQYQLPLSECVVWIRRAWELIPPRTILAAWKMSHIIPSLVLPPSDPVEDPHRLLQKLKVLILQLRVQQPWDVYLLLHLHTERKNKLYVLNQEIIEACTQDEPVSAGLLPEVGGWNWRPELAGNSDYLNDVFTDTHSFATLNGEALSGKAVPPVLPTPPPPSVPVILPSDHGAAMSVDIDPPFGSSASLSQDYIDHGLSMNLGQDIELNTLGVFEDQLLRQYQAVENTPDWGLSFPSGPSPVVPPGPSPAAPPGPLLKHPLLLHMDLPPAQFQKQTTGQTPGAGHVPGVPSKVMMNALQKVALLLALLTATEDGVFGFLAPTVAELQGCLRQNIGAMRNEELFGMYRQGSEFSGMEQ